MRRLIEFQMELGGYVAHGRRAPAAGGLLCAESEERLLVHRNNSLRAIADALASSYPAVQRIVGDASFDGLAAAYVDARPPTERTLVGYGGAFPDFIRGAERLHGLSYLADIARLDRAFLEASTAADAVALETASAGALPFEELAQLAPGLLPSTRIVRLAWRVHAVWAANRGDAPPEKMSVAPDGEIVLLARPGLEVAHAAISEAEARFLEQVAAGSTILAALEAAVAADRECDPTVLVANAFRTGIFKG